MLNHEGVAKVLVIVARRTVQAEPFLRRLGEGAEKEDRNVVFDLDVLADRGAKMSRHLARGMF
jgi:hypothetical protein